MPELPEVETVRRGLAPVLEGARLARVEARRPDLRFPLPDGFVQRLTGARIERLDRRAKYLLAPLDRGDVLVMHLGMSGRFEVAGAKTARRPGEFHYAAPADPKHAHVVFETDGRARVTYFDPRRFGYMALIATDRLAAHPWFAGLGPEPLGRGFNAAYLKAAPSPAAARASRPPCLPSGSSPASAISMSAKRSIAPASRRPAAGRRDQQAARLASLATAVRTVLEEAIEAGGSTLRDYAAADGALGYFQHRFSVYGREGEPCPTPGCSGKIVRIVQAGRSTFYCPACQR